MYGSCHERPGLVASSRKLKAALWDFAVIPKFRPQRPILPKAVAQRLPDQPRAAAATGRLQNGDC